MHVPQEKGQAVEAQLKFRGEIHMSINEENVKELFAKSYNCAQIVTAHFAERLGLDKDTANKMAACFGGGMMEGETCGAVTGALMTIGLKHGHYEENHTSQKEIMAEKSMEFKSKFLKQYNSCKCKEILGYDVSKAEDMEIIAQKNLIMDTCPKLVSNAVDILETIV